MPPPRSGSPIPGHETSARHYFDLVYERSVALSFALAAAGGLDKEGPAPLATHESDDHDGQPSDDGNRGESEDEDSETQSA